MNTSRRHFIKTMTATSALAAAPTILKAGTVSVPERKSVSPNDAVRIGVIGMGIIAFSKLHDTLSIPGVEFVAAADCYDGRLIRTKEVFGKEVFTTRYYEEILQRDDIDAVLVLVPDHWHAKITEEALRAGKQVFCEKPMVQTIEGGHRVVAASKETGNIVQVGSHPFRAPLHRKARELIKAGAIGELNMVESIVSRNQALGAWDYTIAPDASPKTIDWERFLGPAPKRPFDADRFFRWRKYWDYGTGVGGDLYVHLFSAIHYMLDSKGPTRIMATGGVRYWNDGREVPDIQAALYDYPETESHPAFNLILTCNLADGSGGGPTHRFIGHEGVIEIGGGKLTLKTNPRSTPSLEQLVEGYNSARTFSLAQQEAFIAEYKKHHSNRPHYDEAAIGQSVVYDAPRGYNSNLEHFSNFFDAVRGEGEIVQDAVFGLRAAGPSLLVNTSYREGKIMNWDPVAMKVVG